MQGIDGERVASDGLLKVLELVDPAADDEQAEAAEDAEATVDETPVEGDAAHRAGDERKQRDASAGEEPPGDDPAVADGVEVRADEGQSDDQVGEGEPVGAVGEEWVTRVGVGEGLFDEDEPAVEGGCVVGEVKMSGDTDGEGEFVLERKGRDAADDKADYHDGQPDPDEAEERCGLRGHERIVTGALDWVPATRPEMVVKDTMERIE